MWWLLKPLEWLLGWIFNGDDNIWSEDDEEFEPLA